MRYALILALLLALTTTATADPPDSSDSVCQSMDGPEAPDVSADSPADVTSTPAVDVQARAGERTNAATVAPEVRPADPDPCEAGNPCTGIRTERLRLEGPAGTEKRRPYLTASGWGPDGPTFAEHSPTQHPLRIRTRGPGEFGSY